jgi:hypothetical protein
LHEWWAASCTAIVHDGGGNGNAAPCPMPQPFLPCILGAYGREHSLEHNLVPCCHITRSHTREHEHDKDVPCTCRQMHATAAACCTAHCCCYCCKSWWTPESLHAPILCADPSNHCKPHKALDVLLAPVPLLRHVGIPTFRMNAGDK